MVNEELYLRKIASGEEEDVIEHFGGKACDPAWMPQYMRRTTRHISFAEPTWTKDPRILKKYKIYWDTTDDADANNSYWIDMDIRNTFHNLGENSNIQKVHYTTFENTSNGMAYGSPAENYELSKKHPLLARLKGFNVKKYEAFMNDIKLKNQNEKNISSTKTKEYDKDFADRIGKAITPERYLELQKIMFTPAYTEKLKKYITPYVRDYSKQKTAAAIAEPAPYGKKREKRLIDYLALNKVKHGLNALGGIGLATNGVLLLNKQTVPAQTLGTALAMGGTYIAGKNMYGLINDFSKK